LRTYLQASRAEYGSLPAHICVGLNTSLNFSGPPAYRRAAILNLLYTVFARDKYKKMDVKKRYNAK